MISALEKSSSVSIELREAIAEALGKIGDPRAVRQLLSLAGGSRHDGTYIAAIEAIGTAAVEELAACIRDSGNDVVTRSRAYSALGAIGGERSVDILLHGCTSDPWDLNRRAAAKHLARIAMRFPATVVDAKNALIAKAEAGSADRLAALLALGDLGELRAEPQAAKAVGDPNPAIREAGVYALGRFRKTPESCELLIGALADEERRVRGAAAIALGGSAVPPVSLIVRIYLECSSERMSGSETSKKSATGIAVEELENALRANPAGFSIAALRATARLVDLGEPWFWQEDKGEYALNHSGTRPVDSDVVRKLAEDELRARGLAS